MLIAVIDGIESAEILAANHETGTVDLYRLDVSGPQISPNNPSSGPADFQQVPFLLGGTAPKRSVAVAAKGRINEK